jgi:hypothetical protein
MRTYERRLRAARCHHEPKQSYNNHHHHHWPAQEKRGIAAFAALIFNKSSSLEKILPNFLAI